jgi:hypothetical protein
MQKDLTHRIEERRTLAVSLRQDNTALLLAEIQDEIAALKAVLLLAQDALESVDVDYGLADKAKIEKAHEAFTQAVQPAPELPESELRRKRFAV